MSNKQYDWSDSKVIDDVDFRIEDAKLFRNLLDEKEDSSDEVSISSMSVGEILTGRVVEISKDFVVVDVGLKSEGLIQ